MSPTAGPSDPKEHSRGCQAWAGPERRRSCPSSEPTPLPVSCRAGPEGPQEDGVWMPRQPGASVSGNLQPGPRVNSPCVTYPSQGPELSRASTAAPGVEGLPSRGSTSRTSFLAALRAAGAGSRGMYSGPHPWRPCLPGCEQSRGQPLPRAELTSWLITPRMRLPAQRSTDHRGRARAGHTQAPGSPRGDNAGWLAHLSPRTVAPRASTLLHRLPQNWNKAAPPRGGCGDPFLPPGLPIWP